MNWKGHEYVWLLVTDDEYELPLAVFDSVTELARFVGTRSSTISSAYYHFKKGHTARTRYHRVKIK